jgi:hypothetical protein
MTLGAYWWLHDNWGCCFAMRWSGLHSWLLPGEFCSVYTTGTGENTVMLACHLARFTSQQPAWLMEGVRGLVY